MDPLNWLLIGMAILAAWILYRQVRPKKLFAHSTIRTEVRKQAALLIPPPVESASSLFTMPVSPLRIKPLASLARRRGEESISWFAASVCASLWNQQRGMLSLLEKELDVALEAELSGHFVAACSANHPPEILDKVAQTAERTLDALGKLFRLQEPLQLWYGRAMILLLHNRKAFDHVAWLTGSTVQAANENDYFLADNRVVFIPIYTTRLTDFTAAVSREVTQAFLFCYGEVLGHYPQWIEWGLARWTKGKIGIAPPPPVSAEEDASPLSVQAILDAAQWERSRLEPVLREQLLACSGEVVQWLIARHGEAFFRYLQAGKLPGEAEAAWKRIFNTSCADLLQAWRTENPPKPHPATPNLNSPGEFSYYQQ